MNALSLILWSVAALLFAAAAYLFLRHPRKLPIVLRRLLSARKPLAHHVPPPMDTNYDRYARLKEGGASADEAFVAASADNGSWSYGIRMLRAVYGLDLEEAREIMMRCNRRR